MRKDRLRIASGIRRADVQSATHALFELATQYLPLHQLVGVIGPAGHL